MFKKFLVMSGMIVFILSLSVCCFAGSNSMVKITGGTYQMGHAGPIANPPYSDELPQHEVTVSDFFIGRFEVTNAEYVAFLNDAGNLNEGKVDWCDIMEYASCGIEGSGPYKVRPGYDNRPVVFVSWYGAVAYCNWLSEKHGLVKCYGGHSTDGSARWGIYGTNYHPEYNGYRLPTEAEWEYACRAGMITDFSWGEDYTFDNMSPGDIDNYCWYYYNSDTGSGRNHHEVGSLNPNNYGLYDMHGNVSEWCGDYYSSDSYNSDLLPGNTYYYNQILSGHISGVDPTGPISIRLGLHSLPLQVLWLFSSSPKPSVKSGPTRVLRGSSWNFNAKGCLSSSRLCGEPYWRQGFIGFRLVKGNVQIRAEIHSKEGL